MSGSEERRGVIGLATSIATSLPPAFLGLLCVNLAFLALFWFTIERVSDQRDKLIDRLMTLCLEQHK